MICHDGRTASPFTRREALQVGVGMFGLSLPQFLHAAKTGGTKNGKDVSCIFLFLAGLDQLVAEALVVSFRLID